MALKDSSFRAVGQHERYMADACHANFSPSEMKQQTLWNDIRCA
jgi:hypothetical protein